MIMKLATTTGDFSKFKIGDFKAIEELHNAGFKYIDLSIESASLLRDDNWRENALKLKEYADSLGMKFVQSHAPGGNPLDEVKYPNLIPDTIRSIEVCGVMGIPNTVVHAGFTVGMNKEEFFEKNREFYRKLFPYMEEYGVEVLNENSCKVNQANWYWTNTGADIREFTKFVDHPLFHVCWDTGHANCEGSQYDEIMAIGDELYAVHINDNRGKQDEHILPFMGTLNMDEVVTALIDSNYKGYFTMECCSALRPKKYWLGNRRDFEKNGRLAEPQLFMQRHLEKLLYDTGRYILESYDIFEE